MIPGIPWSEAKTIKPFFKLYGKKSGGSVITTLVVYKLFADDHMLVFIPGICTHLLDIGTMHEPCCHITTVAELHSLDGQQISLAPLYKFGKHSVLNVTTLDVIVIKISTSQLVQTFKSDTTIENKLSILHYLLLHLGETDTVTEVLAEIPVDNIKFSFS